MRAERAEVAGNTDGNPKTMYRSVMFTSFREDLRPQLTPRIAYLVYQVEKCPTSGRLHIQGYAESRVRLRLKAFQQELGDPVAHIEQRRGKVEDAVKYCTKEDSRVEGPWILGETAHSYMGKRTDLTEVAQAIINREPMEEIAQEYPEQYIKYHRGMERLNSILMPHRDCANPPLCVWIYGPSGSGKSRMVYDRYEPSDIYKKMPNNKWWDGYSQQKVVLLDDFKGNIDLEDILTWFDRYPTLVESKGGTIKLNSPVMIITSIHQPYRYGEEVLRRFPIVIDRTEPNALKLLPVLQYPQHPPV